MRRRRSRAPPLVRKDSTTATPHFLDLEIATDATAAAGDKKSDVKSPVVGAGAVGPTRPGLRAPLVHMNSATAIGDEKTSLDQCRWHPDHCHGRCDVAIAELTHSTSRRTTARYDSRAVRAVGPGLRPALAIHRRLRRRSLRLVPAPPLPAAVRRRRRHRRRVVRIVRSLRYEATAPDEKLGEKELAEQKEKEQKERDRVRKLFEEEQERLRLAAAARQTKEKTKVRPSITPYRSRSAVLTLLLLKSFRGVCRGCRGVAVSVQATTDHHNRATDRKGISRMRIMQAQAPVDPEVAKREAEAEPQRAR